MIQHVRLLQRAGIESKLFVLRPPDIKVYDVDENLLTSDSMVLKNADILVISSAKDVKYFYKIYKNHGPLLCHLCQGYEPTDLKARISGESIPQKYKCMAKRRKRFLYILKFLLRIKKIERIYSYHTIKITVSQHLKELIEKRYKQKCYLVPNGIDGSVFHPPKNFPNYSHFPIKILCVGSIDVAFKGIPDTLEAITF